MVGCWTLRLNRGAILLVSGRAQHLLNYQLSRYAKNTGVEKNQPVRSQDDAVRWLAEEFLWKKHLQPRRDNGHGANRISVTSEHSHLTDIRWGLR